MRRWNGWGDETASYPLPVAVAEVFGNLLGTGRPPRDVSFADAVAQVPASRLPAHPLVSTSEAERLRHARGQSFPDLIALRSGHIPIFPDGVAFPLSAADVRSLLDYAAAAGVRLIPYGGGTSVVGHVTPAPGSAPILTVDMRRMNRLLDLDTQNRLARFGAGVSGPDLEAQLRAHGYTLGHYPQSYEHSTLGGWVATRSRGQQSLGYGRIEQLFVGGNLEAPAGSLRLAPVPASATGPDLREMVLGSEGRLGLLTEAIVRIVPIPARDDVHAVFFPDWERALVAVRSIVQSGCQLSMLRLSLPAETALNFALAGHRRSAGLLKQLLSLRGLGPRACMLLLCFTGSQAAVDLSRATALGIAREHQGVHVGRALGRQWQRGRFRAPYLRDELWVRGYGVDTVETATTWDNVPAMVQAVEGALGGALADQGERVHAFTHLSHVYPSGSSVYTTFLFRLGRDVEDTSRRWQALKDAACAAIMAHGGTISHQHGIGSDHRPYLEAEKGMLGVAALRQLIAAFDPAGLLNPGKLV
jgi:alkyldihydroxyacetonephosphate synthase